MKRTGLLTLTALLLAPLATLHAAEAIAAFTPGARILFQGDSITDGNRGRTADPNHILSFADELPVLAQPGLKFRVRFLVGVVINEAVQLVRVFLVVVQ